MSEAYRFYMPSAAEFNVMILGVSASLYDGCFAPGAKRYDQERPAGWPTSRTLLRVLDYPVNAKGWGEFMQVMVGLPTAKGGTATRLANERNAKAAPKKAYKFQDHGLALHYRWPWNGQRERG